MPLDNIVAGSIKCLHSICLQLSPFCRHSFKSSASGKCVDPLPVSDGCRGGDGQRKGAIVYGGQPAIDPAVDLRQLNRRGSSPHKDRSPARRRPMARRGGQTGANGGAGSGGWGARHFSGRRRLRSGDAGRAGGQGGRRRPKRRGGGERERDTTPKRKKKSITEEGDSAANLRLQKPVRGDGAIKSVDDKRRNG